MRARFLMQTGGRARFPAIAGTLVLALLLAACAGGVPRLANPPSGSATPARLAIPPGGRISAGPADTVYTISRRYGVPVRDIILANGLAPPYRLVTGQDLRLPAPGSYVVQSGDTVFSISRRFNIDMRTVVEMNAIAPPYQIRVGQELRLPSRDPAAATTLRAGTGTALPGKGASVAPESGPGARDSDIRTALLAPGTVALPRLRRTDTLSSRALAAPRPDTRSAPVRPAIPPIASSSSGAKKVPQPAPSGLQGGTTGIEAAKVRPPSRASGKFGWPVRGRVIAGFGPRKGGLHNDGINIAAPRGAPVAAAENGVVAYAGDGLPGFGKLLLLKHAGGWITAYGHNDRLLVRRGDVVQRGQTIATVGATGNVERPQLHFEIRRRKEAVDPRQHLEKS